MTVVHLVDGTYELFRAYFGAPSQKSPSGVEVGATRSLLRSLAAMARDPEVTHLAVAFDHVVESFRNRLFAGYKTGEGIDPDLFAQFPLAERASRALGIVTWPMVEFEADDAIATAAARFAADPEVTQVRIHSPDKDFGQCVRGDRVVLWDRRKGVGTDEAGIGARLGVAPASVPDLLALVGDTADGIPGIPRWGEKSASAVLRTYGHLEAIPPDPAAWTCEVRGKKTLSAELEARREDAALYQQLATLRLDGPLTGGLGDVAWSGPERDALETLCEALGERRSPL
jgi:5'-3' exonuclease